METRNPWSWSKYFREETTTAFHSFWNYKHQSGWRVSTFTSQKPPGCWYMRCSSSSTSQLFLHYMLQPPLMKKMFLMTRLSLASYQGWLHACPICTVAAWPLSEERLCCRHLEILNNLIHEHVSQFGREVGRDNRARGWAEVTRDLCTPTVSCCPICIEHCWCPGTQKSGGQNVWEFSKTQKVAR